MFQRIDIRKIISDHLKTLRRIDSDSRGISGWDFILFIAIPLSIGILLATLKISLSNHVTDLITFVSILGGFLFNLLAIIYGLIDKLKEDSLSDPLKAIFVKEIHINISFNILLSLFILVSLLIYSFLNGVYKCLWQTLLYGALTAIIYFLLLLFLLTMFMVLNRVYILFKKG